MTKTIAAIATSQSPGGIGVVRISGPAAIFIAKRLFCPKNTINWSALTGYSMHYGVLHESASPQNLSNNLTTSPNSLIDECICLIFRAPRSYTGEDVVEFQCHGGAAIMQRALRAIFAAGASPAEPGEFTRRAFLNSRIDLTEAEAVMQLISASGEQAARAASAAMGGALSQKISAVRAQLISLQAHISAWVDYPEDDIPALQASELTQTLATAIADLRLLLNNAPRDQLMLSGVNTALLGKPNVGKSSLMNLLAGYDRSIVTNIPGTTRDTVTETVNLGSLTLRLTDTAGIHATQDAVEAAGVQRSQTALAQADLLLLVCDASSPLTEEDHDLLAQCDQARTILIRNKCDLGTCWETQQNEGALPQVEMSACTGQGLLELTSAIESLLGAANFVPHAAILANQRQSNCATQALAALEEAQAAQTAGYPLDAISICIEDAIQSLYSLTGEHATDSIVDEVFASFCVGK